MIYCIIGSTLLQHTLVRYRESAPTKLAGSNDACLLGIINISIVLYIFLSNLRLVDSWDGGSTLIKLFSEEKKLYEINAQTKRTNVHTTLSIKILA